MTGTSEGVRKGWEKRKRADPTKDENKLTLIGHYDYAPINDAISVLNDNIDANTLSKLSRIIISYEDKTRPGSIDPSKSVHVFGMQSYDKDGNVSITIYPNAEKYMDNKDIESDKQAIAEGKTPGFITTTLADRIIHEVAHGINRSLPFEVKQEWDDYYFKYMKESGYGKAEDVPSFYAEESPNEMFAESFVGILKGNTSKSTLLLKDILTKHNVLKTSNSIKRNEYNTSSSVITNAGTSEGVKKGWLKRKRASPDITSDVKAGKTISKSEYKQLKSEILDSVKGKNEAPFDVHSADDKWSKIKGFREKDSKNGVGKMDLDMIKIPSVAKITFKDTIKNVNDKYLTKLGIPNIRGIADFSNGHEKQSVVDGRTVDIKTNAYGEMADGVFWINSKEIPTIYSRWSRDDTTKRIVDNYKSAYIYIKENMYKYNDMSVEDKMKYLAKSKVVEKQVDAISAFNNGDDSLMPWKYSKKTASDASLSSKAIKPTSIVDVFENPNDRIKAIVYHEMAHHIHATYQMDDLSKDNGRTVFGEYLNRLKDDERWRTTSKSTFHPTSYSHANCYEWFAENFALHGMNRDDIVDDEALILFKRMENGDDPIPSEFRNWFKKQYASE